MNTFKLARFASYILAIGFFYNCSLVKNPPTYFELVDQGLYQEAITSIDNMIASSSNPASLYIEKAEIYDEWAQTLSTPSSRDTLYASFRSALDDASSSDSESQYSTTIDSLSSAARDREHDSGLLLIENGPSEGNRSTAIAHFDNAVIIDPANVKSYRSKAIVQFNMGNIASSIETLEEGIRRAGVPDNNVYTELGYLYLQSGNTQKAISNYTRAGVDITRDKSIAFGLVNAYIAEEQHPKALELLETLVDNHPNDSQLKSVYGTELYIMTSDLVQNLKMAYQENDTTAASQLRLEIEGNGELAENNLVAAFQSDPRDKDFIESLAVFYNNFSAEYLELAEVSFESDEAFLRSKATSLGVLAIDYYEQLLEQNSDDTSILNKLDTLKKLFTN